MVNMSKSLIEEAPNTFMPGKPVKTNTNGSLPYYKRYWFISTNESANLEPLYISVERTEKIEKILGRLK